MVTCTWYNLIWTIMKRKFKQWWSTIPPISTKQSLTLSHLCFITYGSCGFLWVLPFDDLTKLEAATLFYPNKTDLHPNMMEILLKEEIPTMHYQRWDKDMKCYGYLNCIGTLQKVDASWFGFLTWCRMFAIQKKCMTNVIIYKTLSYAVSIIAVFLKHCFS